MKTVVCYFLLCSFAFAADLEWAGWAKNTADNGILAPSQDLVVVVDSKPLGSATNVQMQFTVNGGEEQTRALAHQNKPERKHADMVLCIAYKRAKTKKEEHGAPAWRPAARPTRRHP